jgi:chromate transporter
MTPTSSKAPVSLLSLFLVFFRIGLFSFGGGLAGWVYREVVTVRAWLTDEEFLSGLALAQVLPGVNVGQRLRGAPGAPVAVFGLLAPPFFVIIGLVVVYDRIAGVIWLQAAMDGAAAAAIGLLLLLALKGGRHASGTVAGFVAFVVTFLCVAILEWPLVPVTLGLAPLSVAAAWPRDKSRAG